jgi:hypothetical protein
VLHRLRVLVTRLEEVGRPSALANDCCSVAGIEQGLAKLEEPLEETSGVVQLAGA